MLHVGLRSSSSLVLDMCHFYNHKNILIKTFKIQCSDKTLGIIFYVQNSSPVYVITAFYFIVNINFLVLWKLNVSLSEFKVFCRVS